MNSSSSAMEGMIQPKPACGGGKEAGEYDLGVHVAGLFFVLGASIIGAGFPVLAKRIRWLKVPPKVFFACKHFGTGVLVATAFVHLLPTAFGSLTDPCLPDLFTTIYPPMPGVIMMASMFCLFVIEMYLNAKTGGHSHGGPTGMEVIPPPSAGQRAIAAAPQRPARPHARDALGGGGDGDGDGDIDTEKKMAQKVYRERMSGLSTPENAFAESDMEMPPWFVIFYEQYVRQRHEMMNILKTDRRRSLYPVETAEDYGDAQPPSPRRIEQGDVPEGWFLDGDDSWTDPLVYRRMSLNITLLEGGILFHSVFVGMTVSLTIEGFIILLIAILFHQMFEGLGLGSRIAAVPYPKGSIRPWLLVFAFGTTAPIGQAIGLAARGSYDPNSAFGLIIVGICNAISSGLLIYAALVDLLAEDFLSEEANAILTKKDKIKAFCFVLLGAIGMAIVGGFA